MGRITRMLTRHAERRIAKKFRYLMEDGEQILFVDVGDDLRSGERFAVAVSDRSLYMLQYRTQRKAWAPFTDVHDLTITSDPFAPPTLGFRVAEDFTLMLRLMPPQSGLPKYLHERVGTLRAEPEA